MQFLAIIWGISVLVANFSARAAAPQALVVPPSEYFEGNDGPWSSFFLRVGTPEQYVRVLVSTASPESLVVVASYGCSAKVFPSKPSDCAVSRGGLFSRNQSSTWHDVGTYGINENGVGLEANLGYSERVDFGIDNLAIGLTGPSLANQTVGGIASPEPFYLGIFGLNDQPVNFTSLGNFTSPSLFTTLKNEKKIPSLSWSYTAGAKYRLKQVYGQLIFSGYDTSRFAENSVSFTMTGDVTRELVVALDSISYSGRNTTTLLSRPIYTFIDSTDPNIWLPDEACDAFEAAFGLALDVPSGMYLVNETHHNTLLSSNAQVSFRLSDVESRGDTVTITLPYAAFDLTAEPPLVSNKSYYFPLKRASNSTQYTLGRTFLQEAYLSADYERGVFNVSSNVWVEGAQSNIVTIPPKTSGSTSDGGGGGSSSAKSKHLSSGGEAGVAVACVIGGILLAACIALVMLRRRRRRLKKAFAAESTVPEADESILKHSVSNSAPHSMPDDPTAPSAVEVSVPTESTERYSASPADSSSKPDTIAQNATFTSELYGCDTRLKSNMELDGREVRLLNSGTDQVYDHPPISELEGSQVAVGQTREADSGDEPFTVGCYTLPR